MRLIFCCSLLHHALQPLIAAACRVALVRHEQSSGLQACVCAKVCVHLLLCVVSAESRLPPAATFQSPHLTATIWSYSKKNNLMPEWQQSTSFYCWIYKSVFFHCLSNMHPQTLIYIRLLLPLVHFSVYFSAGFPSPELHAAQISASYAVVYAVAYALLCIGFNLYYVRMYYVCYIWISMLVFCCICFSLLFFLSCFPFLLLLCSSFQQYGSSL